MIWRSRKPRQPEKRKPFNLARLAEQGVENPDRDALLHNSIWAICTDNFPDNEHNTWHIRRSLHVGDTSYLEIEPEPNDVGYDRFLFWITFVPGKSEPFVPAVYCTRIPGKFHLLSTAPDCPEDIPHAITW